MRVFRANTTRKVQDNGFGGHRAIERLIDRFAGNSCAVGKNGESSFVGPVFEPALFLWQKLWINRMGMKS